LRGIVAIERTRHNLDRGKKRSRKKPREGPTPAEQDRLTSDFQSALLGLKGELDRRSKEDARLNKEVDEERTALERKRSDARERAAAVQAIIENCNRDSTKLPKGLKPELTKLRKKLTHFEERIGWAGVHESIGPVVAESLMQFFDSNNRQHLLRRLVTLGIRPRGGLAITEEHAGASTSLALSGKTFVLTGTLASMSRDDAAAEIRKRGGNVTNSVSKNTSFLVVGADAGATKRDQARTLGVPVMEEQQFLSMLKLAEDAMPGRQQTLF
jgi:NAD-dependent DNA ligase